MFMTILRQEPIWWLVSESAIVSDAVFHRVLHTGKQYTQSSSGAKSSTMKQLFLWIVILSSDPESELDVSGLIMEAETGT
jgi:hypothetical protein